MKKIIFIILLIGGCFMLSSCSRCYSPYWGSCYSVEVVEPYCCGCGSPVSVYNPYIQYSTPYYYAVPPGYPGSSMSVTVPPPPVSGDTTSIYTPLPF